MEIAKERKVSKTRERRKEKTRERILEVAQEMILESGFEKLSLRGVARGVDYSPAGLYEYFANKEELIAAVAARASHRLYSYMKPSLDSPQPLVELGLRYIAFARQHKEEFLLMFSRMISRRQSHQDAVEETSPYALLRSQVQASIASDDWGAPPAEIDTLAYGVWALCHGAAMLQSSHLAGYQADFDAADRAALEALIDGYKRAF